YNNITILKNIDILDLTIELAIFHVFNATKKIQVTSFFQKVDKDQHNSLIQLHADHHHPSLAFHIRSNIILPVHTTHYWGTGPNCVIYASKGSSELAVMYASKGSSELA
ncbi:hypothetical protein ACJX0J_031483, partial [Zea mays]